MHFEAQRSEYMHMNLSVNVTYSFSRSLRFNHDCQWIVECTINSMANTKTTNARIDIHLLKLFFAKA